MCSEGSTLRLLRVRSQEALPRQRLSRARMTLKMKQKVQQDHPRCLQEASTCECSTRSIFANTISYTQIHQRLSRVRASDNSTWLMLHLMQVLQGDHANHHLSTKMQRNMKFHCTLVLTKCRVRTTTKTTQCMLTCEEGKEHANNIWQLNLPAAGSICPQHRGQSDHQAEPMWNHLQK